MNMLRVNFIGSDLGCFLWPSFVAPVKLYFYLLAGTVGCSAELVSQVSHRRLHRQRVQGPRP